MEKTIVEGRTIEQSYSYCIALLGRMVKFPEARGIDLSEYTLCLTELSDEIQLCIPKTAHALKVKGFIVDYQMLLVCYAIEYLFKSYFRLKDDPNSGPFVPDERVAYLLPRLYIKLGRLGKDVFQVEDAEEWRKALSDIKQLAKISNLRQEALDIIVHIRKTLLGRMY